MKFKFINNSKVNLWIENYCFRAGTSEMDITKEVSEKINKVIDNNKEFAALKKDKKIFFEEVKEVTPIKK